MKLTNEEKRMTSFIRYHHKREVRYKRILGAERPVDILLSTKIQQKCNA